MTIRKRLERLEHDAAVLFPEGRCAHCHFWQSPKFPDKSLTVAEYMEGQRPQASSCPRCGWSPVMIVEIRVDSREDVIAFENYHREQAALRARRLDGSDEEKVA